MANPVHPNSSKNPAATPVIRAAATCATLFCAVATPGVNALDFADSRSSTASTVLGAVKRAYPYHLLPTLHNLSREKYPLNPARPPTRAVITIPAKLGPSSIPAIAGPRRRAKSSFEPGKPRGLMTMNKAAHEIAKVTMKYARAE
jgi:hypothetical protein